MDHSLRQLIVRFGVSLIKEEYPESLQEIESVVRALQAEGFLRTVRVTP